VVCDVPLSSCENVALSKSIPTNQVYTVLQAVCCFQNIGPCISRVCYVTERL